MPAPHTTPLTEVYPLNVHAITYRERKCTGTGLPKTANENARLAILTSGETRPIWIAGVTGRMDWDGRTSESGEKEKG